MKKLNFLNVIPKILKYAVIISIVIETLQVLSDKLKEHGFISDDLETKE